MESATSRPRISRGVNGYHLDWTHQMSIEFFELISRNPVLLMDARTNRLNRITPKEAFVDLKPQHIAGPAIFRIPISRDLSSVSLTQNRLKERLVGQARRKRSPPAVPNQSKFSLSGWSI